MNPITMFHSEFNGLAIDIIDHAGKRWMTAEQIGRALGYSAANAGAGIRNLYNRHADEFTEADTCRIDLMRQGQSREVLIFSVTGCNLLSFFSNTPRAKDFRAWAKHNLAAQMEGRSVALGEGNTNVSIERLAGAMEAMAGDFGDAMHAMSAHMGTLAVGTGTVLAQLNITGRYIDLLEKNQRGTVKVTPEIVAQTLEMLEAGTPQHDICRALRISRGTLWRIKGGYRINRVVSGPTESDMSLAEALEKVANAARGILMQPDGESN